MNHDQGHTSNYPRRRTMRRAGRAAGLAVLIAASATGLAACAGAGSPPQVASLGNSSGTGGGGSGGGGGSSASGTGNPTQLLDEWAACIRHHGDPDQADPTINASKDIEIVMNNVPKSLEDEVHGSSGPCSSYLLGAQNALRGGQPAPTVNPVKAVQEAECIRASGMPNYPDPSANGEINFNGTGIDPSSAAVQNATRACDKKLGIPYIAPGAEVPGVVQVTGCNAPPGMHCPALPGQSGTGAAPIPVTSGGTGRNG